jgi:ABC-2 type transport system ATP-binding protein
MLTSLIAPTTGRAWIDGFDVVTEADEVRRRIGLLTETPGLYERLDAVENLDFFGRLHEVPAGVRAERIERLLRLFDLWNRRHERTGTFSKGMKQKLAIARSLLHEPSVLFFDEPTAALDPEAAFIVRDAIETLRRQGRTIVLCTHNLDEAERLCDRIAFVRGRILRIDSPARLRESRAGTTLRIRLATAAAVPPPVEALRAVPGVSDVRASGEGLVVVVDSPVATTPSVVRALVASSADVLEVREESASLESVYFDVMGVRPPTGAFG